MLFEGATWVAASQIVFSVLDIGGIFCAAILGGMVARKMHFDIVGFVVVSIISALGGGILRDLMLQQGPPVALTNKLYLAAAILGAVISYLLRMRGKVWDRVFIAFDAFVVGAWSATGAIKALEAGLGWVPAIMLGVTTAVGGGMIRDISVGVVPAVFGGNTLYATSSILATIPAIVLWQLHHPSAGMILATIVGGAICIAAQSYGWRLPVNYDFSAYEALRTRVRGRKSCGVRGDSAIPDDDRPAES